MDPFSSTKVERFSGERRSVTMQDSASFFLKADQEDQLGHAWGIPWTMMFFAI